MDKEPASNYTKCHEPDAIFVPTFTTVWQKISVWKVKGKRDPYTAPEWSKVARPTAPTYTVHLRLGAYLSVHSSENGQAATLSTPKTAAPYRTVGN